MISLFGEITLIFALCFACLQCVLPFIGWQRKNPYFLASARPLAFGQCVFVMFAYASLTIAFVTNDFSIQYVADNSHQNLPLIYRATAVWGAHEGSVLLWTLMLSFWMVAYALTHAHQKIAPLTLSFFALINIAFLCFLIFTSNPFLLSSAPQTGLDLNPLLQDPGFVIHPPMLYAGYVGFSAVFAITLSAMFTNQLNTAYVKSAKAFAIAAWCFLTLGIMLGSWWAYRVLGWGGFWFWDPVENASLLPWLSSTALIHVLLLVEKQPRFFKWAAILAILTFSLSVLGTFLVRSGVLVSIHSFASDPQRGLFLLIIFALITVLALFIYVNKLKLNAPKHTLTFFSRDTALLLNSFLLTLAVFIILLGTLYPLILESLNLGTLSVGAPYFNFAMTPLVSIFLFIMGCAPYLKNGAISSSIFKKMALSFLSSLILSFILIYLFTSHLFFSPIFSLFLSLWVIQSVFPLKRTSLSMSIAHTGFAVFMIGILLSSLLSQENDVRMKVGDQAHIGPYTFLFLDVSGVTASNYKGIRATFDVTKNDLHITTLYPEKRIYTVRQTVMTHAAVDGGLFRDLYLALGQPLNQDEWSVRLYYKPFIRWIWMGGLFMIIGGIMTFFQPKKG